MVTCRTRLRKGSVLGFVFCFVLSCFVSIEVLDFKTGALPYNGEVDIIVQEFSLLAV